MDQTIPTDALGLFTTMAQNFLTQAVGYVVVTGALYLLVWVLGARVLARRKIQQRRRSNRAQIVFELKNTLAVLLVGTGNAVAIVLLHQQGHTRLTTDIDVAGGPVVVALSLGALILLNDLWFYCWHRLMHTPKLFKHLHSVHHKSVDVSPFSSYSFHVVEGFILGGWVIPVFVFVPVYLPIVVALQGIGALNNLMSHLGYELLPRWLIRIPILNLSNTATFHNLHHTHYNRNFGLHTRLWDRMFGTELEGYAEIFGTGTGGDVGGGQ